MKIILRSKNQYVLRFDPGDEVVEGLENFCLAEKIEAGWFSAIGACREVTLSYYNIDRREYSDKIIEEDLEIVGLLGNVAKMSGETVIHAHGIFSDAKMRVQAGHVKKMVVSATCEVSFEILSGRIERERNEEVGLNLMK